MKKLTPPKPGIKSLVCCFAVALLRIALVAFLAQPLAFVFGGSWQDTDNDGIVDTFLPDPGEIDSDADGIPDAVEVHYGMDGNDPSENLNATNSELLAAGSPAVCLLLMRAGYAEIPQPYIVQGTVAECNPIPAPPLPPQLEGVPVGDFKTLPMWSATVTIKRVISGPEQLAGEKFQVNTANHQPEGNSSAIQPKLEVGDTGIFAIQTLRSGKLSMTIAADVADIRGITLSELPLIKGRHTGYDEILNRFSAQSSNPGEVASTVGTDSSHVDPSPQPSVEKNRPLGSVEPKNPPPSRPRTLVVVSLLVVLMGLVVGGAILIKKHRR